eukprot:Lankesteria_metandrocarpae@DN10642_c0_g1_i1.p1
MTPWYHGSPTSDFLVERKACGLFQYFNIMVELSNRKLFILTRLPMSSGGLTSKFIPAVEKIQKGDEGYDRSTKVDNGGRKEGKAANIADHLYDSGRVII